MPAVVSAAARSLHLRPGEGLSDGRLSESVCRVREGWILSSFSDTDGQRQVAGVLLPGDVRWVTPPEDAAEVTALTPAVVDLIPLAVLRESADEEGPQALLRFYQDAQRPLLEQVRLLSGRSGRAKIERMIGYLTRRAAACHGRHHAPPAALPLTRPVVADSLGMTERHVSRVLKDMESEGLIRLERGLIQVMADAVSL